MKNTDSPTYRGWEYAKIGDYHRNLDPNWSYTPTYLCKMAYVHRKIRDIGTDIRILDAGCGERVVVEEFRAEGFRIDGLDLNYESEYVQKGSVLSMPFDAGSFGAILLLDVFEHLAFADQPAALNEIRRVLGRFGVLVASIPNLAHFNSRFRMAMFGQLDRTDSETNHVGERPFAENRQLLREAGFQIEEVKGVTLTVPFLYRRVICRHAARFRWLHDALEPLAMPALAMLNIFVCRKV